MLPSVENAKNLFMTPGTMQEKVPEFNPYLLLEARIDFNDVRTGLSETYGIHRVVPIPENLSEPNWDSIMDADPESLDTSPPEGASFGEFPAHVDASFVSWIETRFLEYLLRTFTVQIYRNHYLRMYSGSGESENDFIIRCIDFIQAPMFSEFDTMLEVFKRKLARLSQKYLVEENSEDIDKIKTASRNRELFHHISERISALFLRTEFSIQRVTRPKGHPLHVHELEERLQALHFEAQETVTRILDFYEEKVKSVDEYRLHPTLKDIHFVRSFILWAPEEADLDGR